MIVLGGQFIQQKCWSMISVQKTELRDLERGWQNLARTSCSGILMLGQNYGPGGNRHI